MTTKATLSGKPGTFLMCEWHEIPFSASEGDYFYLPPTHVFTCEECGEEMHEYTLREITERVS